MSDTSQRESLAAPLEITAAKVRTSVKGTKRVPQADANIDPALLHNTFIPAQTETGARVSEAEYAAHL